jgi:hypothetical protein
MQCLHYFLSMTGKRRVNGVVFAGLERRQALLTRVAPPDEHA